MGARYESHELTALAAALDGYIPSPDAFLAEVDDRPGGMARLARALADANVNIYGHLFLGRWGDRATFTFVVYDAQAARPILQRKD